MGEEIELKTLSDKNGTQQIDRIQLVVVDLYKSKQYPLNFVCILPRYFEYWKKGLSNSPDSSEKIASILQKSSWACAKHNEIDPEITTVIDKRIKDID